MSRLTGSPAEENGGELVGDPELHVDAVALLVGVLDLSLSQSRVAALAPVDGLAALVDLAALVHLREDPDVAGLVAVVEGEVRLVPVAAHAEPLELLALDVDELHRPVAAQLAQLRLRDLRHLLGPELLLDLVLDRLTVAVPAGHVRRVVAAHRLVLDDEVLEHLVVRGPHVDVAVRVRRAVVQDERARRPCAARATSCRRRSCPRTRATRAPASTGSPSSGTRSAAGSSSACSRCPRGSNPLRPRTGKQKARTRPTPAGTKRAHESRSAVPPSLRHALLSRVLRATRSPDNGGIRRSLLRPPRLRLAFGSRLVG